MHRHVLLVRALLGIALLLMVPGVDDCLAAVYYVDQTHPSASDANAGTTESAPWQTLQRAMSVVAGDTVYVKNGTYVDSSTTSTVVPAFNPANAGTASAPIAFRAYMPVSGSRHRPVVTRVNTALPGDNAPVIGTFGLDYIVWDGFSLGPGTDVSVRGASGVVIENLIIDKGPSPSTGGLGNYDGIRLEVVTNSIIRNNIIRNVYFQGGAHYNAAGIKLYSTSNIHIHNNEVSTCDAGIFNKEGGDNITIERNYVHDVNVDSIRVASQITASRCGACNTRNVVVRNNVVANANDTAINIFTSSGDPSLHTNNQVYNNTIYNAGRGIFNMVPIPSLAFYNNIVHVTSSSPSYGHYVFGSGVPGDLLSNYSAFPSTVSASGRFVPQEFGGIVQTLTEWQMSTGEDMQSRVADPLFVGPLGGTPPVTAFRLQAGSSLLGAGRTGGTAAGAPVNIGAYLSDSDIIGTGTAVDAVAPGVPGTLRLVP